MSELGELISRNVTRLRKERNWSRAQLAARVRPTTSDSQIEKLEKQLRKWSPLWIERVADALGVSELDLLRVEPETEISLSEPAAAEIARVVAGIVLEGREPPAGATEALALMLRELIATLSKYPAMRDDPAVLGPILDFLSRRSGGQ